MYMKIIEVFLTGLAASILGSFIGVGGGFLAVPLLTLLIGIPMHIAIGISLISVFLTSASAFTVYFRRGFVDLKLGLFLETASIVGAFLGANIAIMLSAYILKLIFGIVLAYVSYRMFGEGPAEDERRVLWRSKPLKAACGYLTSFVAGLISGLLGIGGGTLKVPIMVLVLDVPVRVAMATSTFMIIITSATALSVYVTNNLVDVMLGASIAIGALIGAQIGSRLNLRFRGKILKTVFAIVLLLLSLMMIISGINEYFVKTT